MKICSGVDVSTDFRNTSKSEDRTKDNVTREIIEENTMHHPVALSCVINTHQMALLLHT